MDAAGPNIQVTSNGILAGCIGDCSYTFITDGPEVTAQSLTGATLTVTMTDPQSWAVANSDLSVKLGGSVCTIASGTMTSFTCDLPTNTDGSPTLTAGEWNVEVTIADKGLVPLEGSVSAIVQTLSLTSSTPNSAQANGGYEAVLVGNGFPSNTKDVTLTLCGQNALITAIENTEITYIVPKCSSTGADTISLTYDSQTATLAFTYAASSMASTLISISPTSASPVLKQVMTITGTGFGTDANNIEVHLANSTGKVYEMKVLEVTDTELKCGISGGLPGSFDVEVTIAGQGDVVPVSDTADDFIYELVIESISPLTGAYHGGTLLTITGRNFSPNDAENIVFIGNELNWMCDLVTYTATQITCRMPGYHPDWSSSTQGVLITSKLIQDSECPGNNCDFTYNDEASSPSLSDIS